MANGELDKGVALAAGICGIVIVLCGLGASVSGFVWVSYTSAGGSDGFGVWGGVPLIIAGILGIVAWPKRSRGVLIGFLVVCILVLIVAAIQATVSGLAYFVWHSYVGSSGRCSISGTGCQCITTTGKINTFTDKRVCDLIETFSSIFLTITIFSALGSIVCLAGSIIGCIGVCGTSTGQPGATVVHQQPTYIVQTGGQAPPSYGQPGQSYPMAQPGYPAAQTQKY